MKLPSWLVCAVVLALVVPVYGQHAVVQQERSRAINLNGGFESGLTGWNYRPIEATVLTRDWDAAGSFDRYESIGDLRSKLIRIRGNGVWGQDVPIKSASRRHVLNVQAYRKSTKDNTSGSYASAQVAYYDANHLELDTISFEIGGRDTAKNRGIGDGLRFYSWGIEVPTNAASAFVSIYNSSDTETYVDAFHLFEITMTAQPGIARNLIYNPQFQKTFDSSHLSVLPAQGYGVEFWEADRDWSTVFDSVFGSPDQPESAYQFVPILPGRTYNLSLNGSSLSKSTPSGFGVDYYDANWKRIGGQAFEMKSTVYDTLDARLDTPANMAHASVWVGSDTLTADVDFGLFVAGLYLQEQSSKTTTATSAIVGRLLPGTYKYGTFGTWVTVVFSDSDGLDLAQFNTQTAHFTSRSNPSVTYPIESVVASPGANSKTVSVRFLAEAAWEADAGALVIRPGKVKDQKGNLMPTKTLSSLKLPPAP